jgi:outer membrane lipoprotein-sorting protein
MRLREWRLTDREGHVTDLKITQLHAVSGLDPSLFVLDDPRGR